jgi:replicative DNA helicase
MVDFKLKRVTDLTNELDDDQALEALDAITDRVARVDKAPKDGIIHISEALEELSVAEEEKGRFLGLSTGYTTLDAKMGGLEPGSVVLIGGETSNGKSMLALNIALNIARDMTNVLYISLEMTRKQVWKRVMQITGLDSQRLADELDFSVQESFNLEYNDLEPLVRKAVDENGCEIVFIDYLQYLGRGMTEKEVAKMSQVVKRVALKYNVCVVVIVSLRKSGVGSANARKWFDIEVEELMGTAALGYDADCVAITSRKNLENEFDHEKFYVKVLKTRNTRLDFHDRIVELEWNNMKISEEFTTVINGKHVEKWMEVQEKA